MLRLINRLRIRLRSEGGFTLLELSAAIGVILVVFLALAYTSTIAFKGIALARQRQGANGLANQTMEQVRALPFSTLAAGLANTDLVNSVNVASGSYDPNITRNTGCGTPTVYCFKGEQIPRGANTNVTPLVPHQSSVTVGATTYKVAAYVTYYNNVTTANTFRVTVNVSWTNPAVQGVSTTVQSQTINYSGSGCVSSATHPFAAPCQPFLYGSSSGAIGHFDVTGTIEGVDLETATLSLPGWSSNMQVEQISAVQGTSEMSSISLDLLSGSVIKRGGQRFVSGADNDPAQPGQDYSSLLASGSATSLSANGGGNTFTLTPSSGDGGSTTSTTDASVASPANPCPLAGGSQNDQQPCGSSLAQQKNTMSAVLALNNLGNTTLASVTAMPTASDAFTNREVVATSDGLVHADGTRSLGTVTIGGLPSGLAAAALPLNWSGYLVQLTGFTDAVHAETGANTSAPSVTASGSLKYWNGVGYSTLAITPGASTNLAIPSVHISDLSTGKLLQIDLQAAVDSECAVWTAGCPRTGGTSTAQTFQTCSPACPNNRTAASASSNSPFIGDIHYTITYDGDLLAHLTVHVDLGTLLVSNSYQPAPSAG
jgi:type II secretory pathway pseudopilin PulG